jgi:hypothetical protein
MGTCFEAKVWSIRRREGILVVRCDHMPPVETQSHFVVQWRPQDRLFEAAQAALDTFETALSPAVIVVAKKPPGLTAPEHFPFQLDSALARSWLFPEKTDLNQNGVEAHTHNSMNWVDEDLNLERKLALTRRCRSLLDRARGRLRHCLWQKKGAFPYRWTTGNGKNENHCQLSCILTVSAECFNSGGNSFPDSKISSTRKCPRLRRQQPFNGHHRSSADKRRYQ